MLLEKMGYGDLNKVAEIQGSYYEIIIISDLFK
jgi:hypothetical protein